MNLLKSFDRTEQIKGKLFYSNNKQLYFDRLLFSKHSFFCTAKRQKLVDKSRSANSFGNDYLDSN